MKIMNMAATLVKCLDEDWMVIPWREGPPTDMAVAQGMAQA